MLLTMAVLLQVCKRAARQAKALHPEAGKEALKKEIADFIDKSLCVLSLMVSLQVYNQLDLTCYPPQYVWRSGSQGPPNHCQI